jgi:carbamoyl-phosphate synthase small subunit
MAYLALEDGTVYEGKAFGSDKSAVGEVVFNTGMTGYEEVLTDPSYSGQIVVMTYPLIGNYGINYSNMGDLKSYVKGFVVRELCVMPSNWASEGTLEDFLKKQDICGIQGIDTRALTRKIREAGTMRGIITQDKPQKADFDSLKSHKTENLVGSVSCKTKYQINGGGDLNVAVIDCGIKSTIIKNLLKRKLNITVYPSSVTADEIKKDNPDGILISNGPGNPKDNVKLTGEIKKLIGFKPVFGLCLGHQLLALAMGGDTEKLKYGHRGTNHPVKDLKSGKVYITCQNHGYTVIADNIKNAEITHINWNDKTCEGLKYFDIPAFSVQFHPESNPGPLNMAYLYDDFISMMNNRSDLCRETTV